MKKYKIKCYKKGSKRQLDCVNGEYKDSAKKLVQLRFILPRDACLPHLHSLCFVRLEKQKNKMGTKTSSLQKAHQLRFKTKERGKEGGVVETLPSLALHLPLRGDEWGVSMVHMRMRRLTCAKNRADHIKNEVTKLSSRRRNFKVIFSHGRAE